MSKRNDPRFDDMHHAPIFKKFKKEKFKTKLDDRFKAVLTDDRFNVASSVDGVDKHGKKRKISTKKAAEDLKAFYDIDNDDNKKPPLGEENKAESRLDYLTKLSRGEISGTGSDSESESDTETNDNDDDSSSDSETSSDERNSDHELKSSKVGTFGIPGDKVVVAAVNENQEQIYGDDDDESFNNADIESSNRLAIQNCDWDNMTAEDIMAILQSFCSSMSLDRGSVKSVTVYPSDYGLQRMEAENLHGPPKEIWNVRSSPSPSESGSGSESDDEDNGSDVEDTRGKIHLMKKDNMNDSFKKSKEFERDTYGTGIVFNFNDAENENGHPHDDKDATSRSKSGGINELALREYELSKLRYYFAIAELDNASVAEKLYAELDGIEFEHSSVAMDLRFVPNDISFEGRQVRDRYVGSISATYAPPENFVVDALQRTNVECSWDNDNKNGAHSAAQISIDDKDDEIMIIPKGGNKKKTTASAWRRLQESDMSQYMASESDSDGDELSGHSNLKTRAAKLRNLLLGDDNHGDDDFFMESHDNKSDSGCDVNHDDINLEHEDTDKVMVFLPTKGEANDESEAEQKKKKRKKEGAISQKEDWDNPQQTLRRLREERKTKKKSSQRSCREDENLQGAETSNLDLLFAGDDESDVEGNDRLQFTKTELSKALDLKQANSKVSSKKKRKLSKSKAKLLAETEADSFQVDITDDRFSKVLDGHADYGIDRLSTDYRATPGMEKLLNERNSRKMLAERDESSARESTNNEEGNPVVSATNLSLLTKKLKKNFRK